MEISKCKHCYCMTKTIKGKCGKCGYTKEAHIQKVRRREKMEIRTSKDIYFHVGNADKKWVAFDDVMKAIDKVLDWDFQAKDDLKKEINSQSNENKKEIVIGGLTYDKKHLVDNSRNPNEVKKDG